jgi:hypothetical protein
MSDDPSSQIVRAAIHPAIGIARIGNSEDQFFFGPEVDEPLPMDPGSYKDPTGALKRQAACFRVYGYNAAGEAVRELTTDEAEIEWTAHVANRKAAWYEFQMALDIPEARAPGVPASGLRNANVAAADREDQLVIDPGPRTIAGPDRSGPEHAFDTGTFFGIPVYLGELRTDSAGRLVFLGGRGVSASMDGTPPTDFANNDKWHDDVSDGPVTAQVTIDGESVPVDPAWVVVAPPNYAPDLLTVRTMYDLLYDEYVRAGVLPLRDTVSFMRDVYPILQRLTGLQWVNHGFATKFGWRGREHMLDPDYLERLASPLPEHQELRQQIWNAFRDWERDGWSPVPWPWMYGDAVSVPTPVSPRQHITLSPTQLRLLERWKDGDFESDLDLDTEPPQTIEDVALADQPATLDRAALTFCLADAFHPGCEMTWPMRHTSMYMAPFRLSHRPSAQPEGDFGKSLTPGAALSVGGPLYGQTPGTLSRWMAVPWQTDTASCLSGYTMGYELRYDAYLPTFWPARVPNQVLTESDYDIVMDEDRGLDERQTAFERRAVWYRWLDPNHATARAQMVTAFGKLGLIETRPGPADGNFPDPMHVESEVTFDGEVDPNRNLHTLHVPEARGLDPDQAEPVLRRAVEASGHPPEHVQAGYFAKLDPFRRGRP